MNIHYYYLANEKAKHLQVLKFENANNFMKTGLIDACVSVNNIDDITPTKVRRSQPE